MHFPSSPRRRSLLACLALAAVGVAGCKMIAPSNDRVWTPDQERLSWAEFHGSRVTVHNIRNCTYVSQDDYIVDHYDKTFDMNRLESVDFLVVPFAEASLLAHTMLSFNFDDGEPLTLSVEIRKEEGESFAPIKGSLRQFEIMYVLGDERDLVKLRTNYRLDQVFLYRSTAPPEKCRELLVDVLNRANKLAVEPEFYDTLRNNCTTNIAHHINRLSPGMVPYSIGILLPGYSDRLAYNLGLIRPVGTFEETKRDAYISDLARAAGDSPDFSRLIRR